jgi:glutamate formiminotransferase/formiminotetrahydrofolate cyclodeaminase
LRDAQEGRLRYSVPDSIASLVALLRDPLHAAARTTAIREALLFASRVPLETAELAVRVAALASLVAEQGNTNAVTDACVAALMAEAACKGAVLNVRINLVSLDDQGAPAGAALTAEAFTLLNTASAHARAAEAAAERAMGVL